MSGRLGNRQLDALRMAIEGLELRVSMFGHRYMGASPAGLHGPAANSLVERGFLSRKQDRPFQYSYKITPAGRAAYAKARGEA